MEKEEKQVEETPDERHGLSPAGHLRYVKKQFDQVFASELDMLEHLGITHAVELVDKKHQTGPFKIVFKQEALMQFPVTFEPSTNIEKTKGKPSKNPTPKPKTEQVKRVVEMPWNTTDANGVPSFQLPGLMQNFAQHGMVRFYDWLNEKGFSLKK